MMMLMMAKMCFVPPRIGRIKKYQSPTQEHKSRWSCPLCPATKNVSNELVVIQQRIKSQMCKLVIKHRIQRNTSQIQMICLWLDKFDCRHCFRTHCYYHHIMTNKFSQTLTNPHNQHKYITNTNHMVMTWQIWSQTLFSHSLVSTQLVPAGFCPSGQ